MRPVEKGASPIAMDSKADLATYPHDVLRRQIVRTALAEGCFSIWMKVFADDPMMRRLFIDNFPGTSQDCFNAATTEIVSPRPSYGLTSSGKI